ncbi:dihydrofolate reductase family protein [Cryptosporangium phraense]|uniref:Dihydrofolate reductase n=1 Tax=Cryptosporangium phraense TaxID=2593070 RepID=A0A545AZQ8_9ACTN|nr:dihydrofolate reductase family protein [Cryptosporangium phraense]TQS46807.1 dihydrofolate reductase [Cryptosporangium phraense]
MRSLVVTENITLDGVIDADGGWFDPAGPDDFSDVTEALNEQMRAADAFLTGRETFEAMRGYWPARTDDTSGVSAYLNQVQKYVVSSTLTDPGWEPTTVLRGLDEIGPIKRAPGKDIVVTGSVSLVQQLVAGGLVDEFRLFVYPVVKGSGRRLFEGAPALPRLGLAETRAFRSGVVLVRYRSQWSHASQVR